MEIIDISPLVSEDLAVWPGDQKYERKVTMDMNNGDHLGLSTLKSTLHLGAHTDAPNHYGANSPGIHERSLYNYFGPVQVIEVHLERGQRILPEHLGGETIKAPRVLFKTGSFPNPNAWNKDFCSLSPELVDHLADQNVLLVGIDTPSVDLFDDKELLSHNRVHHHNMSILEGIVLDRVSPGLYTLAALPLALKDADASPVRAVLITGLKSEK